jgi:hypothetical protein
MFFNQTTQLTKLPKHENALTTAKNCIVCDHPRHCFNAKIVKMTRNSTFYSNCKTLDDEKWVPGCTHRKTNKKGNKGAMNRSFFSLTFV